MQKYLPHIRIPFKLFDDERIKKIPEEYRSSSLLILISLLKFVNAQNGQCYPRQATISSMVCLHRSTIYRCTELLQEVGILKTKRLKSTLLYTINPDYIVNKKYDVSSKNSNVSLNDMSCRMMTDINRTTINLTNIDKLVREVVRKGGDKNLIIDKLSTLPRSTLIKAVEEKDNPYYCNLALNEQDNKGNGVLVDIPKNIMSDIKKKSHFGYQQKVSKTKRDHDRKIKSKDLLRSDSQD
nr:putative transcriptional regulator [uncultured Mediterranean phage uvMED]